MGIMEKIRSNTNCFIEFNSYNIDKIRKLINHSFIPIHNSGKFRKVWF